MKYVLAPFVLIYKLYFGLVFFVTMVLLYPLFLYLLRDERNFKYIGMLFRFWSRVICVFCLIYIRKIKRGEIPEAPYVVCANHTSYLDIVLLPLMIPNHVVFMAKHELTKWPMMGVLFRKMHIPVNRKNPKEAAEAFQKTDARLKAGHSIAIYPEGGIPKDAPKLKRLKNGAFQLAIKNQVPIVPITFINNYKIFASQLGPLHTARPGIAKVVIHEPIYTEGLTMEDQTPVKQKLYDLFRETMLKFGVEQHERYDAVKAEKNKN